MASKGLNIEKHYPLVGAALITGVSYYLNFNIQIYPSVLTNALTITAIFIGFMGTLAGILLGSSSKPIRFMKRINKLSTLLKYIWTSIQWSFIFLFITIILQFLPTLYKNYLYVTTAWVFTGSYSLLLTHRGISITTILLRSSAADDETNNK